MPVVVTTVGIFQNIPVNVHCFGIIICIWIVIFYPILDHLKTRNIFQVFQNIIIEISLFSNNILVVFNQVNYPVAFSYSVLNLSQMDIISSVISIRFRLDNTVFTDIEDRFLGLVVPYCIQYGRAVNLFGFFTRAVKLMISSIVHSLISGIESRYG